MLWTALAPPLKLSVSVRYGSNRPTIERPRATPAAYCRPAQSKKIARSSRAVSSLGGGFFHYLRQRFFTFCGIRRPFPS